MNTNKKICYTLIVYYYKELLKHTYGLSRCRNLMSSQELAFKQAILHHGERGSVARRLMNGGNETGAHFQSIG